MWLLLHGTVWFERFWWNYVKSSSLHIWVHSKRNIWVWLWIKNHQNTKVNAYQTKNMHSKSNLKLTRACENVLLHGCLHLLSCNSHAQHHLRGRGCSSSWRTTPLPWVWALVAARFVPTTCPIAMCTCRSANRLHSHQLHHVPRCTVSETVRWDTHLHSHQLHQMPQMKHMKRHNSNRCETQPVRIPTETRRAGRRSSRWSTRMMLSWWVIYGSNMVQPMGWTLQTC